jgi:hypothetical protein
MTSFLYLTIDITSLCIYKKNAVHLKYIQWKRITENTRKDENGLLDIKIYSKTKLKIWDNSLTIKI